jgi:D-arabinose 1-dehydrogenase-like Zn-dependent alcohol dehydrogenase
MAKMRVVQVPRPNGPLELVEREIPEPGTGTVRIKVQACGICHSDSVTKQSLFPGIQYPRVPGHEVIGLIDAIGPELRDGPLLSVLASAGTAAIAAIATPAATATPSPA